MKQRGLRWPSVAAGAGQESSALGRRPRVDGAVEVDPRTLASTPQAAMQSAGSKRSVLQQAGVAPVASRIEVRRRITVLHEEDVDIQPVAHADDVAKQPPVAVDQVRLRFRRQTHQRSWRRMRKSRPS